MSSRQKERTGKYPIFTDRTGIPLRALTYTRDKYARMRMDVVPWRGNIYHRNGTLDQSQPTPSSRESGTTNCDWFARSVPMIFRQRGTARLPSQ